MFTRPALILLPVVFLIKVNQYIKFNHSTFFSEKKNDTQKRLIVNAVTGLRIDNHLRNVSNFILEMLLREYTTSETVYSSPEFF